MYKHILNPPTMKRTAFILMFGTLLFAGCNNSQREAQIRELSAQDSTLLSQTQQKDSSIMAYVHSLNEIEENLNTIKQREHLLSMSKENGTKDSLAADIVGDIRSLDDLIVKNHREMFDLEKKLKASDKQDMELRRMVTNLSKELSDKDAEIAELESKLSRANDSIKTIVADFRDSIVTINRQKMEINTMRTEMNTVYYTVGTYKELKKVGVLTKEGGVIGIGSTPALKQNFNSTYFTSALMPDLQTIPLYSKFVKLVTNHPSNSYKVVNNGKVDSFVITDPASFWSESKYTVIIVDQEPPKKNEVTVR
jgi:outer membrane murein-binding lipoprotein Lpp